MDVCDFHSHILPRADHGSNSVEVSLAQLELAKKYGVSRIVATPHFYPQKTDVSSFLKRRSRAVDDLMEKLDKESPEIALGAEILICDNIENLPDFKKLCFGESNVCLLELPFNRFEESYVESVYNLVSDGYYVILAHADRYDRKNIEKLLYVGAKIQLNVVSLATIFKKKHLYDWMEREKVVALGSDIHMIDQKAYKNFFIAKKKVNKYLENIKKSSDELWSNFKIINSSLK